jgi:hypothetical protein
MMVLKGEKRKKKYTKKTFSQQNFLEYINMLYEIILMEKEKLSTIIQTVLSKWKIMRKVGYLNTNSNYLMKEKVGTVYRSPYNRGLLFLNDDPPNNHLNDLDALNLLRGDLSFFCSNSLKHN